MPTPSSKEFNTHWHLFSFFLSLIFLDKFSIANYDAWTRQNGRRTCVRLGNARVTPLPTRWCCVWVFLFFIFLWICADSASIRADFRWIGSIRPESDRIGWIESYRLAAETDQNGRNKPKLALNHAETAEINFEWGPNILNLSFLNYILNICCFFCVFFFVLCFLPSSFFVLWTKDI